MTNWIITTTIVNSGNAYAIGTGDSLLVAPTGVIASQNGYGVWATGASTTMDIYGTVFGSDGIYGSADIYGDGFTNLRIGTSGVVSGYVAVLLSGDANSVTNAGSISGTYGIYFFSPNSQYVNNSGTISSSVMGIYVQGGGNTIINSGKIASSAAPGISINSAVSDVANVLDNSGTISGGVGGADAIIGGNASLTFTNSGHVLGAVRFGAGTNVYDGTLGNVAGTIYAGSGSNTFTGGAGAEIFNLTQGSDTVDGGAGNDTFLLGANLGPNVSIDGGAGTDTVVLNGDYSTGIVITPQMMSGVEVLKLAAGYDYNLTTNDSVLAAGQTLTINGGALGASDYLVFNGAKETNGHLVIYDGLGSDTLTMGSQSDKIIYAAAADSTSTGYDTVVGWNFNADKWDIPGGPGTIKAVNAAVTAGTLSTATFDANLQTALAGHLLAHDVILFKPNAGTLSGQTFMVVDMNGTAGYQAGADLVVRLQGNTGTLGVGGFV